MDDLRTTPTQSHRLPDPPRRFVPAAFFAHKDRLARLCLLVTLVCCLSTSLAWYALIARQRQATQFIVLDAADNVIIASGRAFDTAREFHVQQTLLASTALLARHAKDFDQPEMLPVFFSKSALAQAAALKASEATQFQEHQFQQKPQLRKIDVRETTPSEVHVRASGELLRFGVFRDRAFTDVIPFTLELVLQRNPDLLRNRQQPTVVSEFTLTYDPAHP